MSAISDGITLSLRGLSRELGVDRTQLTERVRHADIEPAGERGGHPVYRLRDVLALILDASGHGDDPDKMCPRDRLDYYKAENERVKLEAAQGRLVLLEDVITTRAATFKALVLGLETLPDRIEIAVGLNAAQVDVMIRCIDGMREQLYTELKAAINV